MTQIENDLLPGRGHNIGFIDLDPDGRVKLIPQEMRDYLIEEIQPLTSRRDELLGSVSRAPLEIADEVTSGRVADLCKLIAAAIKNAETDRVARKEPFLEGGRIVDAVFRQVIDPLDRARIELSKRLTVWQRKKAEEERQRREAEARRQAEEAARQRAEAEAAERALQSEADLDRAIAAQAEARQSEADAIVARRAAEAKPAELSRERSDYGAVASLRQFYDFDELDRDNLNLETLRPFIPLDALEKAVRAFIRAGGRELRGVRIFPNTTTRVA